MAYEAGSEKADKTDHKELLERIRRRFKRALEADAKNRKSQTDNAKFIYVRGAQWPDKLRKEREEAGDECMEFPQLRQFVDQVVNDQRQERPAVKVSPVTGDASVETAEIVQGVVRGIERDCGAEGVYDEGYRWAVVGGRGYWRIGSEYEREDSFHQKLVIRRIADPNCVVLDPDFQDPDGGDREFGFVFEDMDIEDVFKKRYPKADAVEVNLELPEWYPKEGQIRVADYYERVCAPATLVMLGDGTTAFEDEVPAGVMLAKGKDGKDIKRETERYTIAWYTVGGGEQILETHSWPGTIIPIVCAMGSEIVINGERIYQGLVDQAKDTQTLLNFGMTQQAIHLASAPRTPFIGAAESVRGYEALWNSANTANFSFLPYNHLDSKGQPLPSPTRQPGTQPDAGWINWTQQMMNLMRSIIGMYENSLGMKGQEKSGVAIRAREMQGDNATFHYLDNFSRAIKLTGRILIECLPTFYDTERIVTIVGPDDVARLEKINQRQSDVMPLDAIARKDITVGKYAVTAEAGPGYATKRQEMAELTMQMVQSYPPMMQFAGDIVVRMQDVPEAEELAERFKLMLPPPIQQFLKSEEQGQNPDVAQANAQMQQMAQQLQQMQQQMQMMGQENESLKADKSASIAASQAKMMQAQASMHQPVEQGPEQMSEIAKAELDAQTKIQTKLIEVAGQLMAQQIAPPAVPGDGAEEVAEQRPVMDMATIMAGLQQTAQALGQAMLAPRQLTVQTDEAPQR